ncbi:unnamed protein product [Polarella glacialis]|uniref:Uncharacterized protein n=1 Tax=Polarella glacialis TaxID=89957 RepID=A0A813JI71_POLGL|nr:unnamed protein product [Polarella glacialis]CAE8682002.1 unnamed protein product [Polarella glacialis]
MTPLHLACRDNSAAMVRLLLCRGANSAAVDSKGRTAADICEEHGSDQARKGLEGRPEGAASSSSPSEAPRLAASDFVALSAASAAAENAYDTSVGGGQPWFGSAVDPSHVEDEEEEAAHAAAKAAEIASKELKDENHRAGPRKLGMGPGYRG